MAQTANNVLEDLAAHKNAQVNARTTEGIYATLEYQQSQIQALADYIDGKRTETTVTPPKVVAKQPEAAHA
jgi:hypothetical protein